MVVIRGAKKFLDRTDRPLSEPPPSTTVLGDWYANVLFRLSEAAQVGAQNNLGASHPDRRSE